MFAKVSAQFRRQRRFPERINVSVPPVSSLDYPWEGERTHFGPQVGIGLVQLVAEHWLGVGARGEEVDNQ